MPSFFDRVREAATDLGQQAQRGIDQGQAKLDESRVRRECDDLAKQIGYLVHRARTEGTEPDAAELDRLSGQLITREQEMETIKARAAAAPQQQSWGGQWGQPGQQQGGWAPQGQQQAPQQGGWAQQADPWGTPLTETPQPPNAQETASGELPEAPAWGSWPPPPGGESPRDRG